MSDRKVDRRTTDRKKLQFAISWMRGDEAVGGVGTEISLNGLVFATKTAPHAPSFNVVMSLASRRIKARLVSNRKDTVVRDGIAWSILACTFEGIAADDYDTLVRFIRDLKEPENKAQSEIATAAGAGDDAYRLLPLVVQKRIVQALAGAGKLAPDSDAKNPLLRMTFLGSKGDRHRFAVHSRMMIADQMCRFDSMFTVDENGNVTLDT